MTNRTGSWAVLVGGVVLVVLIGASALLMIWISSTSTQATVPYSRFLVDVEAGRVTRVAQQGTTLEVSGRDADYQVVVPTILTDVYGDIQRTATGGGAAVPEFIAAPAPDASWIGLIVTGLLPVLLVLVVVVLGLLVVVRPARREGARALSDRLRALDEAHKTGLITDEERERQRTRILDEV